MDDQDPLAKQPSVANTPPQRPAIAENTHATALTATIELFKRFDIHRRKVEMDQQSLEIADRQEESTNNRKRLAEATKNFKKADATEKVVLVPALLKSYQDEIDSLTKRSKAAEALFLKIYQDLHDLPDPLPFLQIASESFRLAGIIGEKDEEIRKLRQQNQEYYEDLQFVKNQEITIRKLEDQIRESTEKMSKMVQSEVATKEKQFKDEYHVNYERMAKRETELLQQLQTKDEFARQAAREAETAQSNMLELQQRMDAALDAKQELYEITAQELLRSQEKIVELESKLNASNQLPAGRNGKSLNRSPFEKDLDLKNMLIEELRDQITNLEKQVYILDQRLEETSLQLSAKQEEADSLRVDRDQRPPLHTYQDLQRKYVVLQGLDFGAPPGEVSDRLTEEGVSQGLTNFETSLLEKHRVVYSELTKLKLQTRYLEVALEESNSAVKLAMQEIEELKRLNEKLEDDLSRAQQTPSPESAEYVLVDTSESGGSVTPSTSTSHLHPNPPQKAEVDSSDPKKATIVQIITGQRDRFRQRVEDLEKENKSLRDKMEQQRQDAAVLQNDNVKLFEKIKYLQSYNHAHDKDAELGMGQVETKYSRLYEDSLNPFAQFHKREATRRFKEMNTADRVTFATSNILHANKQARKFVFFYTIFLHLFVFFMLYQLATYRCEIYEVVEEVDPRDIDRGGIGHNHM